MRPYGSDPRTLRIGRVLAPLVVGLLAAASLLAPAVSAGHSGKPKPPACQLSPANGAIKHVIYVQFDNVHFLRDNPNVPSDVEQMPNLLELHRAQRHALDERSHGPDLAHRRRNPEHADGPVPRPARAGRLELVWVFPA